MSAEMPPPAGADEPNDKAAKETTAYHTARPELTKQSSEINPDKPAETPKLLVTSSELEEVVAKGSAETKKAAPDTKGIKKGSAAAISSAPNTEDESVLDKYLPKATTGISIGSVEAKKTTPNTESIRKGSVEARSSVPHTEDESLLKKSLIVPKKSETESTKEKTLAEAPSASEQFPRYKKQTEKSQDEDATKRNFAPKYPHEGTRIEKNQPQGDANNEDTINESINTSGAERLQLENKLRQELAKYNLQLDTVLRYPTSGLEIKILSKDSKTPLTGAELKQLAPKLLEALPEKDEFDQSTTLLGEFTRPLLELLQRSPELFQVVLSEPTATERLGAIFQEKKLQFLNWFRGRRSKNTPVSSETVQQAGNAIITLEQDASDKLMNVLSGNEARTTEVAKTLPLAGRVASFLRKFIPGTNLGLSEPINAAQQENLLIYKKAKALENAMKETLRNNVTEIEKNLPQMKEEVELKKKEITEAEAKKSLFEKVMAGFK